MNLTVREVAARLRKHRSYVYRRLREFRPIKTGSDYVIPEENVAAWEAKNTLPPPTPHNPKRKSPRVDVGRAAAWADEIRNRKRGRRAA